MFLKSRQFSIVFFLLINSILVGQENYIAINAISNDNPPFLLRANNNGIKTGNQILDLRFSEKFNFKKNENNSITYYARIVNDEKEIYFNEIGFKLEKNQHYSISVGKISDGNFYLPENTSGSMLFSNNYEPIPQIKFSISKKKIHKNIVFSTAIAHGFLDKNEDFYKRPYLHHKYLYFDFGNIENNSIFTIGLHHAAVWGGATTIYNYGDLGRTLNDFWHVLTAREGEGGNIRNAQGNHLGIFHFSTNFTKKNKPYYLYYQKFWEDKGSLLHFAKFPYDGLWGFNMQDKDKSLTIELLKTTFQSGNYHPKGIDSYYWHIPYTFGWEYRDFTIGNFQISPDSNRVESIYIAYTSKINSRIKLTSVFNQINRYTIAYQDKGWHEEIDLSNDTYTTYKMLKLRMDFSNNNNSKIDYYYELGFDSTLDDRISAHRLGIIYKLNF